MPVIVNYVSLDKIKRNVTPIQAELMLDIKFDMIDVQTVSMGDKEGVRSRFKVVLTDLETGDTDMTEITSSAPTLNKGESISLANAQRMFYTSRFGIVDGMDYEEHDADAELKSALSERAIEPLMPSALPKKSVTEPTPVPAPAPASVPTPAPAVDSGECKVSTESERYAKEKEILASIPLPAKVRQASVDEIPKKSTLSMMEEKGCQVSMAKIEKMKDSLPAGVYDRARQIFDNRSSNADVSALMQIVHEFEKTTVPSAREGM